MYGGTGNDYVHGGSYYDTILARVDGEDWIYGECDNDTVSGGIGPDHVWE